MRYLERKDIVYTVLRNSAFKHCACAIESLQKLVCNVCVFIVHRKIIDIIGIRRKTAHHKTAFSVARKYLFFYFVRTALGYANRITGECFRELCFDLLCRFRRIGCYQHNIRIVRFVCSDCSALDIRHFRISTGNRRIRLIKRRFNSRKEHYHSNKRHKEYRHSDKYLVFEKIFKFKSEYCFKLLHCSVLPHRGRLHILRIYRSATAQKPLPHLYHNYL